MSTHRWTIQAGEPQNPDPEGYPPKVSLEEFLIDDHLEAQPEDVNDKKFAEAIANPDLETRGNGQMRDALTGLISTSHRHRGRSTRQRGAVRFGVSASGLRPPCLKAGN